MLAHQRRVHKAEIFPCEKCDKQFKSSQGLRKHTETIHDQKIIEKHTCDLCGKEVNCLKSHKDRFHSDTKFPCNTCGKIFSTIYDMKTHSKQMHVNKDRIKCDVCKKEIIGKSNFLCHMKLIKMWSFDLI